MVVLRQKTETAYQYTLFGGQRISGGDLIFRGMAIMADPLTATGASWGWGTPASCPRWPSSA